MSIFNKIKNAYNAFTNARDPTGTDVATMTYSYRPDRVRFSGNTEKSIITSVYNRIAMDAAAITINHVRLDDNGRYVETIDSALNECLTIEANKDQTARAFMQDVYMSMLDEGCIAVVPVDTTCDPNKTGSYDITSMRTGKIIEWAPDMIKVQLYNDRTGNKEEIWLYKRNVAILESPLYAVVNERNSTIQRLIRKLNLLDAVDEQSSSGKLDLIIQLPYSLRSPIRKQQAEKRRSDIVDQLTNSKYGIAYTDATEKITQLNRPVENNLMKQIEYLTGMMHGQLGMTPEVMNGSADEKTMLNYYNRSIEPLVSTVVDEYRRKFLTRTARTQRQSIWFFRDPFRLVPVSQLADIGDTFKRNEIMSSNELRQIIGLKPSTDSKADELINSNLNHPDEKSVSDEYDNVVDNGYNDNIAEEEIQNGE